MKRGVVVSITGIHRVIFFILLGLLLIPSLYAADITSCSAGIVEINDSSSLIANLTTTSTCISINASNVLFNCSGFTIRYNTGSGSTINAIIAENLTNITIKDCVIHDLNATASRGVAINWSRVNNSFIINTTIQTNGTSDNYGISLINSFWNTIANNTINTIGTTVNNFGIVLNASSFNNISNNTINTNGTVGNHGFIFSNNASSNNMSSNIIISAGTISSRSNVTGVFITASNSNALFNNTITVRAASNNTGITIERVVSGTIITNNSIAVIGTTVGNFGIFLNSTTTGTLINGNSILVNGSDQNQGIRLQFFAQNNTIIQNTIRTDFGTPGIISANHGIFLTSNTTNNTISHNRITARGASSTNGIRLETAVHNNTLNNNTILTLTQFAGDNYGIFLFSNAVDNVITNNTITTNGTVRNYGIRLQTTVRNTTIANNSIVTQGTSTDNVGIYLNASISNIIITNNTITTMGTNTNYGINFEGTAENSTIIDNNITTAAGDENYGIRINNSLSNTFARNSINVTNTDGLFIEGATLPQFSTHSIATSNIINGSAIQYYGGAGASPLCPNSTQLNSPTDAHIDFIYCNNITLSRYTGFEVLTLINASNITINHSQIRLSKYGIRAFFGSSAIRIESSNISTNSSTGSGDFGIWVQDSSNATIIGNNISTDGADGNNFGIYLLTGVNNSIIAYNNITTRGTSGNVGLILEATGTSVIANNTIITIATSSGSNGIQLLSGSSENNITNNLINISAPGTSSPRGILISVRSTNNTVNNNTILPGGQSNFSQGIEVINSSGNIITNNNISCCESLGIFTLRFFTGITVSGSENTSIRSNRISINASISIGTGIIITRGNRTIILNNTVLTADDGSGAEGEGGDGIGITGGGVQYQANFNNVSLNDITTRGINGGIGISVADGNGNDISSNTILVINSTSSGKYGVLLQLSENTTASNNTITMANRSLGNPAIFVFDGRRTQIFNNSITTNGDGFGSFTQVGIEISRGNDTNIFNNSIVTNGLTGNNYGILVGASRASFTNITANHIRTHGASGGNAGIRITTSRNNNITENIITTNSSSGGNAGIEFRFANDSIISSNNITTDVAGSHGINFSSSNNNVINPNSIIVRGTGSSGMVFSVSRNNSITLNNITVSTDGIGIALVDSSNNTIRNITFSLPAGNVSFLFQNNFNNTVNDTATVQRPVFLNRTAGSINYTATLDWTNTTNFAEVVLVRTNLTQANTTRAPWLNASALIFLNVTFADPRPVVDVADNGTFGSCSASVCTEINSTTTTFVFNVTQFTSYAAAEGGGCPLVVDTTRSLSGNLVSTGSCVTINGSNLVFNCSGFNITIGIAGASNVTGILVLPVTNVTIRDCIIRDPHVSGIQSRGITFLGTNLSRVQNTSIFTNGTNESFGMLLQDTNSITIFNNSISTREIGSRNHGIFVNGTLGNGSLIANNTITTFGNDNNYGINIVDSSHSIVSNNTISTTGNGTGTTSSFGINLLRNSTTANISTNTTISSNTINTSGRNQNVGIRVVGATNVTIMNNVLNTGGLTGDNDGIDVPTGPVTNLTILHNTITVLSNTTASSGIMISANESSPSIQNSTIVNNTLDVRGATASGNTGIALSGQVSHTLIENNTIRVNGSRTNGITLTTNPFNVTLSNNSIVVNGTTGINIGIRLLTTLGNNSVRRNTINATGSNRNTAILLENNSFDNNIFESNTLSTTGIASFGVSVTTTNHSRFNNTVFLSVAEWFNISATTLTNFTNTNFTTLNGTIQIPGTVVPNSSAHNVSQRRLNISFNRASLRSVELAFLNTTGRITLHNLTFVDPTPTVDFEDDGTFVTCPGSICTEESYSGGTFVFGVTQFSSYSSSEGGGGGVGGVGGGGGGLKGPPKNTTRPAPAPEQPAAVEQPAPIQQPASSSPTSGSAGRAWWDSETLRTTESQAPASEHILGNETEELEQQRIRKQHINLALAYTFYGLAILALICMSVYCCIRIQQKK